MGTHQSYIPNKRKMLEPYPSPKQDDADYDTDYQLLEY